MSMNSEFPSGGGFLGREAMTSQTQEEIHTLFDCGTLCLLCGRIGEAYACYSRIREADNSALWFNRALCLQNGGEYDAAFDCLQRADTLLRAGTIVRPADRYQTKLDERDAQSDGYLRPMSTAMPNLFPDDARRQILRVMADVAYLAGRYEEVRRVAGRLGRHYKNVDEILELLTHSEQLKQ